MKIKLLFLILALPLLSLGQCMHVDSVYNKTGFDAIENRSIQFGVKQLTEEILQDKLPEDLHNIMIAYSIRGDDNRRGRIIQEYFDFVRKNDATIKKQLINRDLGNVTVKQFVNSL